MIYLTGDTHIPVDIKKLNTKNFPEQKNLSRDDFVIVLGDFGLLWKEDDTYRHWKKWLEEKPFTLLWLDGNHENHDWIGRLPISRWRGGKVHFVSDNIIHLMRGQIFSLAEKSFFVCGGASSVDKEHRVAHVSWWPQEDILWAEYDEALSNLDRVNNKVDYILTHTCPHEIIYPMFNISPIADPTSRFLDEVAQMVDGAEWYFGHHHIDKDFGRFHCLYQRVVRIV